MGALILTLLVEATGQGGTKMQPQAWQPLASTTGHFSILMPGAPVLEHSVEKSFLGLIHSDIYKVDTDKGEEFSIEFVRVPAVALFFVGGKSILNRSKKGLLKDESGEAVALSRVPFGEGMGEELIYKAKGKDGAPLMGMARFLILKRNLYILAVTASPSQWDKSRAEEFLNSFEILPTDGK